MNANQEMKNPHAQALGKLGGKSKSEAKKEQPKKMARKAGGRFQFRLQTITGRNHNSALRRLMVRFSILHRVVSI